MSEAPFIRWVVAAWPTMLRWGDATTKDSCFPAVLALPSTPTCMSLYVVDGTAIPSSLGVNPFFTISAVAERCAAYIAEDRGWTIDYEAGTRNEDSRTEHGCGTQ